MSSAASGKASEPAEPERLTSEDIGEMFLVAHNARRVGCPRVQADPAHIEALCLEVLRGRAAKPGGRVCHEKPETD